ncbi:hypothetical protein HYALB_00005736 [Hymenoscyphus albidus]|uniref:Uncharacterized protein n=1 Tax=Hymenoscyphus albidus TaxID=595503 RepID=A0A9N9LQ16_9HELO|nr:hypothetical protein HYALB_00005736 [Hymenoscyphus albidus]
MSTYGMSEVNCTVYLDLQPNPDISGIGCANCADVSLGFFITAYLSFFCCAAKLFLDHWESLFGSGPTVTRLSLSCRGAVISFGDQQLVTGISILVAGFLQLEWGISAYHWHSVVNQAWLSTITYFMVFTAMKDDIHKSRRRRLATIVRFAGMGILIIMLIVALIPMGFTNSRTVYAHSFPAWCFYHNGEWKENLAWQASGDREQDDQWERIDVTAYNWPYLILTVTILLYNFCTRIFWLQRDQPLQGHVLRRIPVITGSEKVFDRLRRRRRNGPASKVIHVLYRSFHTLLVSSIEVYSSALWEMTWITTGLVWGTIRITVMRKGLL